MATLSSTKLPSLSTGHKRGARATPAAPVKVKRVEPEIEGMSSLEARVYRNLLRLGWKKEQIGVQVSINGGRSQKGGQVVDFVVYIPQAVPIRCQGEWWHRDGAQELWEASVIYDEYGRLPVDIYGNEAETDEDCRAALLRKLGRP